ncbi:MAG TPA: DUF3365 domain-containing protein [Pirellulales bacterium]|jgi:hypothetical protein|nr:DUF3365 domain-containing protein [Pirellulales bacterium]
MRPIALCCGVLCLLAAALFAGLAPNRRESVQAAGTAAPAKPRDEVVERARREVKMLDDLYKTAIVFINDTYVEDGDEVAAGEIARNLFAAMREKGWHDARLVDATGEPMNAENAPRDEFEKAANRQILKGKTYYEEIVQADGKNYLRAATVVPVVNKKCILCHPGHEIGEVLGTVSYKLPLE